MNSFHQGILKSELSPQPYSPLLTCLKHVIEVINVQDTAIKTVISISQLLFVIQRNHYFSGKGYCLDQFTMNVGE